MKIIDAHLHLFDPAQYEMETGGASPFPAPDELPELYKKLDIRCGVVMGNETLSRDAYRLPPQFRYCIGVGDYQRSLEPDDETLELVEYHLRRKECAGIKVYTGYAPVYAGDKCLAPYYRLAGKYGKAVAFHTGMTADNMGRLKYSPPLTLDDAAAAFPDVQFVMECRGFTGEYRAVGKFHFTVYDGAYILLNAGFVWLFVYFQNLV